MKHSPALGIIFMTCSDSSLALPWEYAAFWCKASIRYGADSGGGVNAVNLTDTSANFDALGCIPNVGQILYNLTTNASGPIVAVTQYTLTATGVTWTNGDRYRVVTLSADEASSIQLYLDITAADVYAAIASSGACDCTWTTWGTALVKKLNIIEAAVFHACPCGEPNLTNDQKTAYMEFVNEQLQKIIDGEIDICGGTGSQFPALDWATQATTDFSKAQVIVDDMQKGF
jgi:hypothetical protein